VRASFGEALRAARRRRLLSQEELADTIGLHRTYISMIERDRLEPRLDTLVKLCRGLGISPAEAISWYVAASGKRSR
jgi:transcriptional regulator with XRE-family HTH domain